ncbi:2,5-diamino-6-(ribosylamino)-4(3H)-pyrimidinone 5'-phosphate reductase [Toensbergia leucococca]|nr:2,5-diamino-6-(ribosylamino)-4(3H)-pyrimidinone 5'-phosphate reductase [Toensbergia leucococca]
MSDAEHIVMGDSPDDGQVDESLQGVGANGLDTVAGNAEASSGPSRTFNDLLRPPHDLAMMRQRLFDMQDKIELQVEEFERYWPYVDNVWVRQHRAGTDRTGRLTSDYYACRLQRPTYTRKDSDKPRPEGKPSRKKQIREGGTCQMKVKTVRYNGGYSGYTIMQVGDHTQHTHDLNHMDKIKRTTVLMDIARSEVMKGYMPASVFTVMNEDIEKLTAAGGRYLNRNDVRNASQAWRQVNREQLGVHLGYKYDHGNGIVRQDDMATGPVTTTNVPIVDPALSESLRVPPGTLHFPIESRTLLEPYLPPQDLVAAEGGLPFVTLSYATSMDSSLSLTQGIQTVLSGPESKAMTHYLRSRHDAILVGVGTAVADDPGLNCRLEGVGGFGGLGWEGQPRPVVIDPGARWLISPHSKILKTVAEGKGRGPWVIIAPGFSMDPNRLEMLKFYGGKYLGLTDFDQRWRLRWEAILKALAAEGIRSVMIEGGGMVINDLLQPEHARFISSAIVTMAPTYLGKGGVVVSPPQQHDEGGRPQAAVRFEDVKWQGLGQDVVMCGRLQGGGRATGNNAPTTFGALS